MATSKITTLVTWIVTLMVLVACSSPAAAGVTTNPTTNQPAQSTAAESTTLSATSTTTTVPTASATAGQVMAENSTPTAIAENTVESMNGTQITLSGDSISVEGTGVFVEGSTATITAAGTYTLSGTLVEGQIIVDSEEDTPVYLILNGATIHNSTSAPLYIKQAEAVELILADHSENRLSDGATYVYANAEENEPNAALFSDDTLLISGNGALTVEGNYNDGIASKDGLTITGGTIIVTALDDGIRGKDYLIIQDGILTVTAGGDGLKSDNTDDVTLGYVAIEGGTLNLTTGDDGVQAETDLVVTSGALTVTSGGGNGAPVNETMSVKGLKAGVTLTLEGGTFAINAADDALHSDSDLTINGGTYTIAAGDDGIHGEINLTMNGGDIEITHSYEGIESGNIVLNGGTVSLVSTDDGINAASGDGVANAPMGGGRGGGARGGGNFTLTVNGGTFFVNSGGDGVDVNGTLIMNDGLVIVNGPTERMNGAFDYDGGFTMNGGTAVAVGSAGMATAPDSSSSQNALLLYFNAIQQAGTTIHIQDNAGNTILTFTPDKSYQSLAFSSPLLVANTTYELYLGGSTTSDAANGLGTDGNYSGGTLYTTFTVSGVVTQVGNGGGFR